MTDKKGEAMSVPYIIAEVGSNWKSYNDCINAVTKAHQCGADAVKFQLFTHKDLYGFNDPNIDAMWNDQFYLKKEWIPAIKEKCDVVGIDFMCTAFSGSGYEFVNEFVDMHKVASSDMNDLETLALLREIGKPIILSTGSHTLADIEKSLHYLWGKNGQIVYPLYCVTGYPTKNVDLRKIGQLNEHFKYSPLFGFSDHTVDVCTIPTSACLQWKAPVLEKHFNPFGHNDCPDSGHSIGPDNFKLMVEIIRGKWHDLLNSFDPQDLDMQLKHKRRLVALKDIKAGEKLKINVNYGSFRSKNKDVDGAHPFRIYDYDGRIATRDFKQGEGVSL